MTSAVHSLERLRRGLSATRTARLVLLSLFCVGAPLVVALALAAHGAPWWAAWAGWLIGFAALGVVLRGLAGGRVDLRRAAAEARRSHPELGDELLSALELAGERGGFARLQAERAARLATACGLPGSVSKTRGLRRPLLAVGGLAALYLVLALFAPRVFSDGWLGLRGLSVLPPRPRLLEVRPGDLSLRPGEEVSVEALFDAQPGRPVVEVRRAAGETWRTLEFEGDPSGLRYSLGLEPLDALGTGRLEYRVSHADGVGEVYRLELLPVPRLSELRLRVTPPAYTGLPPREQALGEGGVVAPRGSGILFEARATPSLERVELSLGRREPRELELRDADGFSVIRGGFSLVRDDEWRLEMLSRDGLSGEGPTYRLVALPDEPPTIELYKPSGVFELDPSMTVPLSCVVADDYGVARLELLYGRRGEGGETSRVTLATNLGLAARVDYRWDLGSFDLLPGDELLCRLRVVDNNAVDGPGTAYSPTFVVRFPGVEKVFDLDSLAGERRLGELAERESRQSEALEELARRHRGSEEVSWEERRMLEGFVAEQESIVARAEETLLELQRGIEALDREGLLTPESLAKLNEVQRLLHEALDRDLRRNLEELQRAVDEYMSRGSLEELAQRFEQSRQEFEERLERMEELLLRARAEQRLAELASTALAHAGELDRLLPEPGREAVQSAAQRSKGLLEGAAEVARLLAQLPDPSFARAADAVEAARERLDQSGAVSGLEGAVADPSAASRSVREAAAEHGRFAEELASALQELRADQHSQLQRILAVQVNALLLLADELSATRGLAESRALRGAELARRLVATAGGLRRVRAGLEELYRQSVTVDARIPDALGALAGKLEAVADQSASTGGVGEPLAPYQATLANLTLQLLELQRKAAQTQSGTGLSEMMARLGELAAQQQALNLDTQAAGEGEPGADGASPGADGFDLEALAARQAAIRLALEQLGEAAGNVEGLLGDLGELASQAGGIERLLQEGALGPQTQLEQQLLLRRLLDAQRSLQSEELARRREARQAGEYQIEPPPPLSIESGADDGVLRPPRPRLDSTMFWPEFREAIGEYLRRLEE